jgi:hypothetical protein
MPEEYPPMPVMAKLRGATAVRLVTCAVVLSLSALMGCITDKQPDKAQFDAADNDRCISYGTTPGTPAYTDCRMKLERLRELAAINEASRPPKPFKNCPTAASGLSCTGF